MKKIHFIMMFCFVTGFSNLFSQAYYKLLKEDRYWIYTKMGAHDPPIYITHAFALTPRGDTLLFGNLYKKIYRLNLMLNVSATNIKEPKQIISEDLYALMREDTIERKVYLLPFHDTISMCQPTEHLLYDFSLQVGDTLNSCVLENIYRPFMDDISRIDSIRQIVYSGLETRAFYMQGVFDNYGDSFEDTGLILEGYGYERHGLINYGKNGPLVLFQYFCEGDSLDCELLSAVAELPGISQSVITLSPNPTPGYLTIQIDQPFPEETELQVSLLNAVGNVVLHLNWNTFKALEVDVTNLHDGVYFLNVYGKEMSAVKKIVIAH